MISYRLNFTSSIDKMLCKPKNGTKNQLPPIKHRKTERKQYLGKSNACWKVSRKVENKRRKQPALQAYLVKLVKYLPIVSVVTNYSRKFRRWRKCLILKLSDKIKQNLPY